MSKVKQYTDFDQATNAASRRIITNEDIVRSIICGNGEIDRRAIATSCGRERPTIWNWLNKRTVVPAYAISGYVNATGDTSPLDLICEACGYVPVPMVDFQEVEMDVREMEVRISIYEGKFLEKIENALSPDSPGGTRIINSELRKICRAGIEFVRHIRALMKKCERG